MFNTVSELEKKLADFFGSPYAVAVDCCTHGLELCLRFSQVQSINVPRRTYVSIPLLADKLNIKRTWKDENWKDYYYLTDNVSRWKIIDAAVLWERNSYIAGTYMCISFQFQKHLSLGRGGVAERAPAPAVELAAALVQDVVVGGAGVLGPGLCAS